MGVVIEGVNVVIRNAAVAARVAGGIQELERRCPNGTDPQGYAPLHSAAWGGHTEAAKVLLANGARIARCRTPTAFPTPAVPVATARAVG